MLGVSSEIFSLITPVFGVEISSLTFSAISFVLLSSVKVAVDSGFSSVVLTFAETFSSRESAINFSGVCAGFSAFSLNLSSASEVTVDVEFNWLSIASSKSPFCTVSS